MRKNKTITIERKPRKCPNCGGKVVKIIYGMPGPELMDQCMNGEIILGGCCIMTDENGKLLSPEFGCLECDTMFKRK